jgi:DNA polymerase-3 subunit gamma/tau
VPPELALTAEADAALLAQAERVDHATVVRLLELIGSAMEAVRAGADARTRLELALVKAARPEVDGSLRALLARIERLERGGAGAAPAGGQPAAEAAAEPPSDTAQQPHVHPDPEPPAGNADAVTAGGAPVATAGEPADPTAGSPARADAGAEQVAVRDLDSVAELWPAVIDLVRGENAMLGALIAEARPVAAEGEDLILAFAGSAQFMKKKAEDPANRMTVGEALRAVTGVRWRLSYELRETPGEGAPGMPQATSEEEWVKRFIDEFDAEELPGDLDPRDDDDQERALMSNEKGA